MNLENYAYLNNSLTRLGFDGMFDGYLKTAMELGKPTIELQAQDKGTDYNMQFAFHFSRKEGSEYYFLNNVVAALQKPGQPDVVHDFFLFQQKGYNIPKMKNMLEGRSVYSEFRKDGRNLELWRNIDFTKKDEKGNNLLRSTFDKLPLEVALNKIPTMGLTSADKASIIEDLKNGFRVPLTIKRAGNREQVFIEASPFLGIISMFNDRGEKVYLASNLTVIVPGVSEKEIPQISKELVNSANQQESQQQSQKQTRRAS